jgi:predicted dienelactone hydrolase
VKKKGLMRSLVWGCLSGFGFSVSLLSPPAAIAAEKVYASYGFIELTILVKDLENYAKFGRLSPALQAYAKYLKPDQLHNLREALKKRIELSSQVVSQFLYTPTGEKLLERGSSIVKARSKGSSVQALRSAIILSANDPEGMTVLKMLQNYPDNGIQLDVAQGIEVFQGIRTLVQQTNTAISLVNQQAETAARSVRPAQGQDLAAMSKAGTYGWDVTPLSLVDNRPERLAFSGKVREYSADIYLPKPVNAQPVNVQPLPLIIISHGLGSGRKSFKYFAEHLASHGYAVAVPEHPGSSNRQLEALVEGRASDVSSPTEFLDRPMDVSYLLDELTRLNRNDERFKERLNLRQVGMMGQSFGGNTALELVGAKFDFQRLKEGCGSKLSQSLNLSLLLQCQVEQLPQKHYALQDPRIKAAIAVNPIGGTVFGPQGFKAINKPLMIISGSSDAIAPPLAEQIEPFTWLPALEKRLILVNGATHFSTIDEVQATEKVFVTPKELVGRTPDVARLYMRALGLSFFQTYVKQQPKSSVFLTSASIQAQSLQPLALRGVTSLSVEALAQMKNAL